MADPDLQYLFPFLIKSVMQPKENRHVYSDELDAMKPLTLSYMTHNIHYQCAIKFIFRNYLKLKDHEFKITHCPHDYGFSTNLI